MPQTEKPALTSEERGGAPTRKQQNGYGRHLAMKKTMRNLLALAILGCVLFWGTGLAMADQQNEGPSADQAEAAPLPDDRLTGMDVLLMQNAVSTLWGKGDIAQPGREVNVDSLSAPEHVFVELIELGWHNKAWVFRGQVRRMAPRNDGIEVVAAKELFSMRFHKVDKGNFYLDELKFEPLPNLE